MLKLTNEEEVFAKQLFDVRAKIEQLTIEERTHVDRLLTILRGHQSQVAQGQSKEGVLVKRVIVDSTEMIMVTKYGRLPHELHEVPGTDGKG